VIRGATPHFEYVSAEVSKGIASVSLETGVPIAFGVITADTPEQAEARTRPPLDRGAEAARSVVELAHTLAEVRRHAPDRG
jgi:6,7-dimethyl-8-ribityllumazine synthase